MTALCSDCRMQSLHCAITIIGGRQPARDGGVLANFPTFQLSDFSTCRLAGSLALWLMVGGLPCCWVHGNEAASTGRAGGARWVWPTGGVRKWQARRLEGK